MKERMRINIAQDPDKMDRSSPCQPPLDLKHVRPLSISCTKKIILGISWLHNKKRKMVMTMTMV